MKQLNNITISLLLFVLIGLIHCGPPEPVPEPPDLTELEKLPPPTQEGLNTFGCLINGKAMTERLQRYGPVSYTIGVFRFGEDLSNKDHDVYLFFRMAHSDLKTGEYILNDTSMITTIRYYLLFDNNDGVIPEDYDGMGYVRVGSIKNSKNNWYWPSKEYGTNRLTITHLDRAKYIVSGTFEFTVHDGLGDTLRITNGRFGAEYIPY